MSSSEPISSLKGIGEKTGKLFEKLGVITIDDLLSYYPRAYDTYETAVPVGQLKEQMVMSVAAALPKPPDLLRTGKIQMVSAYVRDMTGTLQLAWYNICLLYTSQLPALQVLEAEARRNRWGLFIWPAL